MQDTVRYLLPTIPSVLYSGLGRHQVERLAVLRKATELTWEKYACGKALNIEFDTLFHDVLAPFDGQPGTFSGDRVQDELIGQISELLGIDYNVLELDVDSIEHRQRAVSSPPPPPSVEGVTVASTITTDTPTALPTSARNHSAVADVPVVASNDSIAPPSPVQTAETSAALNEGDTEARLQGHIISPADSTERLQTIQQLVAEHTGEPLPTFTHNVLQAIPVQAGGLFPISDVWYIEPGLDSPDRLRIHIAQFAQEIAEEAELVNYIEAVKAGIGFTCIQPQQSVSPPSFDRMVLALLHALSIPYSAEPDQGVLHLDDSLAALLLGTGARDAEALPRLSDNGLVKFFRLVRLARRLWDLEANPDKTDH